MGTIKDSQCILNHCNILKFNFNGNNFNNHIIELSTHFIPHIIFKGNNYINLLRNNTSFYIMASIHNYGDLTSIEGFTMVHLRNHVPFDKKNILHY